MTGAIVVKFTGSIIQSYLLDRPGEPPVEAQFTGFQQGARGAGLVTSNMPRRCANIETEYIGP